MKKVSSMIHKRKYSKLYLKDKPINLRGYNIENNSEYDSYSRLSQLQSTYSSILLTL